MVHSYQIRHPKWYTTPRIAHRTHAHRVRPNAEVAKLADALA